eukprot:scaffold28204_cov65-Phaeocystis_antarctica.AAC.4
MAGPQHAQGDSPAALNLRALRWRSFCEHETGYARAKTLTGSKGPPRRKRSTAHGAVSARALPVVTAFVRVVGCVRSP